MARTQGIALLEKINEGRLQVAPSEFLQRTREDISTAIEELVDVGARIRPLHVGTNRVGWVRGVHLSERKALRRWVTDDIEFVEILLCMATSLPVEYIRNLSLVEFRSLSRVVKAMSDSDLRLYPFISAFVTTSQSEQLWFSKGTTLTSFTERIVKMPDGAEIRVTAPSDQAKLWATLCNYRMQAKQRLDASMNALLTIRPVVGKGADPVANELKAISRSLQTDTLDPWREMVQFQTTPNLDDGWAHSGDDSVEGIMRELHGMVNEDRHEQVWGAFDKQERERAEAKKIEIEKRVIARGGRGFIESNVTPMTEAEVQARAQALRQGRLTMPDTEEEVAQSSPMDRLAKYG